MTPPRRSSGRGRSVFTSHRQKPHFSSACSSAGAANTESLDGALFALEQQLATIDQHGIQLHQYATATVNVAGRDIALRIESDYPWAGGILVDVTETPQTSWRLTLRIPAWSQPAMLAVKQQPPSAGCVQVDRVWRPGDRVELQLEMPARITLPDPRIDALRGCAALERGPLVYCLEQDDLPNGVDIESIKLDDQVTIDTDRSTPDQGFRALGVSVRPGRNRRQPPWPCGDSWSEAGSLDPADPGAGDPVLRLGKPRPRRHAGLDPSGADPLPGTLPRDVNNASCPPPGQPGTAHPRLAALGRKEVHG
jgi:hypothetical protein